MPKVIGIVGSRRRNDLTDYELTYQAFLSIYEDGDSLVSGGCLEGGDRFAEVISNRYGIPIKIYPAEWRVKGKYDRTAGFKRNTYIAQDADVLIACVASDRKGGTEDTVKKYLALGKEWLILV